MGGDDDEEMSSDGEDVSGWGQGLSTSNGWPGTGSQHLTKRLLQRVGRLRSSFMFAARRCAAQAWLGQPPAEEFMPCGASYLLVGAHRRSFTSARAAASPRHTAGVAASISPDLRLWSMRDQQERQQQQRRPAAARQACGAPAARRRYQHRTQQPAARPARRWLPPWRFQPSLRMPLLPRRVCGRTSRGGLPRRGRRPSGARACRARSSRRRV